MTSITPAITPPGANPRLPLITPPAHIDDVLSSIATIIDWSIANESRLGYFAALYRRITLAIKTGIEKKMFDDNERMERFDVVFASRYFAALNAFFYGLGTLSHSWQVALKGAMLDQPIIVQHLLAGVNAHIDLDLGIAAEEIAPGAALPSLHGDFIKVNEILGAQVKTVLDEIDSLSPVLADIYKLLKQYEIDLIDDALKITRDGAWSFASDLAYASLPVRDVKIALHDFATAEIGML
ncbi:MAG TPA: DUF5995 family protein, partial [Thermoanaerobaculia bacterium]|nr:DUF5995 family protein [Thermoanaerobaculia bacterium]